jgi:DNA-binding MarR family transcriptional regulator
MRRASAQSVLLSQTVAARVGINSTDLECLDLLHLQGGATAGELAAATGLTTGAITGVIDRLEAAGYATRERDPSDRRKVLVRPLPAAARRIAPLYEPIQQAMAALVSRYSDDELALLVDFASRSHELLTEGVARLREAGGKAARSARGRPPRA